MKVLHFSTWATGGAAVSAAALSDKLTELGTGSSVVRMSSRARALLDAAIGKLGKDNNPYFHSYNFVPDTFKKTVAFYQPDLVHIHWIGAGFVRPESLSECSVPIIWTLHDLWPFLGGEHLLTDDKTRMIQGYRSHNRPAGEQGLDLNRLVWERKRSSWNKSNIVYVCPSKYIKRVAKQALLAQDQPFTYIPNGIDTSVFSPIERKPGKKLRVFLPAMNMRYDRNKGIDIAIAAISRLDSALLSQIELILAGDTELPPNLKIPRELRVRCHGVVNTAGEMAKLYRQADLSLIPSRFENLPYAAIESMGCGTPVVAFRTGGIPEIVSHSKDGYLASPYDIEDLAKGIILILKSPVLRRKYSSASRASIIAKYDLTASAEAYSALYAKLTDKV